MSEMVVGSHLGHKVNKFKIFVDRRKSASKCSALDMRRTDFRLIRGLVSKVPGESFWRCWVSSALITFGTSPPKGRGSSYSQMSEVKQVRQKAGLAEQQSSLKN